MQSLTTYRDISRHLLAQGFEELAAGDLLQASEKGWGAAAHMIKAVAQTRGWEHSSHSYLFQVAARVVRETGDHEILDRFMVASALHQNFYENWANATFVNRGLHQTQILLTRLERALDVGPIR